MKGSTSVDIKIIFEDENIIVVEKPPKVPSQKDPSGDLDLMSILAREYLGLIHRLDRPVGGVMVFSKNKKATSFLSKGIASGGFHKQYLSVVCGIPKEDETQLTDYLIKDGKRNISFVTSEDTLGSKEAILSYNLIQTVDTNEFGPLSLLLVTLETGRHHQIRVQLSHNKLPIWGDTKYNPTFANKKDWTQIALWAHTLKFRTLNGKKVSYSSYPYDEYPWNLFDLEV